MNLLGGARIVIKVVNFSTMYFNNYNKLGDD